jgi:hypothetical protein
MAAIVYRYQWAGINPEQVKSQINPATPFVPQSPVTTAAIDVTTDDAFPKSDLDDAMAAQGFLYTETNPTAPAADPIAFAAIVLWDPVALTYSYATSKNAVGGIVRSGVGLIEMTGIYPTNQSPVPPFAPFVPASAGIGQPIGLYFSGPPSGPNSFVVQLFDPATGAPMDGSFSILVAVYN